MNMRNKNIVGKMFNNVHYKQSYYSLHNLSFFIFRMTWLFLWRKIYHTNLYNVHVLN